MKNVILIVAGDPNSINTEIIAKVWKRIDNSLKKKIYLLGNFNLIKNQLKKLNKKILLQSVKKIDQSYINNKLKIIDVPLSFAKPFKVNHANASKYIIKCLNLSHKLAKSNEVKGMINCPIDKSLISKSRNKGVTEFLALKCGIKNSSEVMLIHNKKLSVLPLTTHIRLKDVSKKISKTLIEKKINTLQVNYKKIFKKKPRLGVLGLNPHNAEFTKDSEEFKIIVPTISKLRKKGYSVFGPISSDTSFVDEYKKYDVLIGMYHDQVLSPFKTLFQFDAINLTLGLKYIRVSPDHGPGKNILRKNIANHESLLNCVKFIDNLK